MKRVIVGAFVLCAGSIVYAAGPHDAHVPVAAHAQTAQHVSKGADGGAELSKTLTVSDCWIRSLPRPPPSAGYFVIKNAGNSEAKLASMSIDAFDQVRSEEPTSELQSLMRISYAVFGLKKNTYNNIINTTENSQRK